MSSSEARGGLRSSPPAAPKLRTPPFHSAGADRPARTAGRAASAPARLNWPLPCLTTPPHLPPWAIWRLRPLLRTPEQSLSRPQARRGRRSSPQAGPKLRSFHFQPAGGGGGGGGHGARRGAHRRAMNTCNGCGAGLALLWRVWGPAPISTVSLLDRFIVEKGARACATARPASTLYLCLCMSPNLY